MLRKHIVTALVVTTLLFAASTIALGVALHAAKQDVRWSDDNADYWKKMASKAYVGYLMAISIVGDWPEAWRKGIADELPEQ